MNFKYMHTLYLDHTLKVLLLLGSSCTPAGWHWCYVHVHVCMLHVICLLFHCSMWMLFSSRPWSYWVGGGCRVIERRWETVRLDNQTNHNIPCNSWLHCICLYVTAQCTTSSRLQHLEASWPTSKPVLLNLITKPAIIFQLLWIRSTHFKASQLSWLWSWQHKSLF